MHTNTFCKYRKKLLASPRVHLVKDSGTIAWFNDALTILVTIGDNSSTHSLSSQLGIGSSSQDLLGAFKMI